MKNAFRFLRFASACLIALSLIGCVVSIDGIVKLPNNLPVVEDFSLPTVFEPGEILEFSIVVHDKDGDTLTYNWEVDAGKLNATSGATVKWTAPKDDAAVKIIVSVSDGVGKPIKAQRKILNSQPKTFAKFTTQVLTGHTDKVYSVTFSPDGKTIASGSGDKTIRLWNAATGDHLRTLTGRKCAFTSVAFSPDGKTIAAVGGIDIYFWDVTTGFQLHTITGNAENIADVLDLQCISYSPDGKTIAGGGGVFGPILRLWDADTGTEIHTLNGHDRSVRGVSFSPDGKLLASASEDRTIRIWETATGQHLGTLTERSVVHSVAFSPDGKTLASGTGIAFSIWDVATGEQIRTTMTSHAQVTSVAFSPNGKTIATGDSLDNLLLWDVATGAEIQVFPGHTMWLPSVSFSPDGNILMSGSGDGTIRIYE